MSKPVRLYRFVEGTTAWTVTDANKAQTYNSETYTPITISLGSAIESKQEANRGTLDIVIDLDNAMAQRWLAENLVNVVSLTLYLMDGASVQQIWSGKLNLIKPDLSAITFTFDDGSGNTRRGGDGLVLQPTCPYVLYGIGCFANKASFATTGTIATITSNGVTVAAAASQADGYYTGGMIKDVNGNVTFITSHIGSTLTLFRPMNSVTVGDAITIYAGCDRLATTCKNKFSNLNNYGGFQWIPTVNIFAVIPIA